MKVIGNVVNTDVVVFSRWRLQMWFLPLQTLRSILRFNHLNCENGYAQFLRSHYFYSQISQLLR